MKQELRLQFFKIVEAKHSIATQEVEEKYQVLTEQEIFQAIKNIPGVRMIPGSYKYQVPTENVVRPWGPEIFFQFEYKAKQDWSAYTESPQGDQHIINIIQAAIKNKYSNLVYSVYVKYANNNLYEVTITEPHQN